MAALELIIGIMNFATGIMAYNENDVELTSLIGGSILIVIGILFTSMVISFHNKIKFLKREKAIRE
jgi:hypothetical protein